MKSKSILLSLILIASLSACNEETDGIPKLADPANPVVDGVQMKPSEFLSKYCPSGKREKSETCMAVLSAANLAAINRPFPKFDK